MPYYRARCNAGRTRDFEYYYTYRYNGSGGICRKRGKREKPTKEAQKVVNWRRRCKKLTRILNANFSGDDYYITLTYKKEERPDGTGELRKQIRNLLDRLRKIQLRDGNKLKYVWTAEVGKRGATHIHIVANKIDIKKVRDTWIYGFIDVKPLDTSGQYRKLAEYLIKYSEDTEKNIGTMVGNRYNPSRNLKQPVPDREVIKSRKRLPETIRVPSGWYLDKESVRSGIHEFTGMEYLSYTLIKLGSDRSEGG